MGCSKSPFLQRDKINRLHHSRKNLKIIINSKELAGIFNELFVNIIPNLGINTNHNFLINMENKNDPIEKTIPKYKNHPSMISIKRFMESSDFSVSS